MGKILCIYGDSAYWLTSDGAVVICSSKDDSPENGRPVYSVTPIKMGYKQFMPSQLAQAMEKEDLFY